MLLQVWGERYCLRVTTDVDTDADTETDEGRRQERERENPASTEREREREKERKREETKGRQETTEKRVLSRLMPRFKSVPLDVSFLYFLSFGREVIIVFLCLCETLLISLFL